MVNPDDEWTNGHRPDVFEAKKPKAMFPCIPLHLHLRIVLYFSIQENDGLSRSHVNTEHETTKKHHRAKIWLQLSEFSPEIMTYTYMDTWFSK